MNNLYIIGLIVLVIIILSLYACKNDNIKEGLDGSAASPGNAVDKEEKWMEDHGEGDDEYTREKAVEDAIEAGNPVTKKQMTQIYSCLSGEPVYQFGNDPNNPVKQPCWITPMDGGLPDCDADYPISGGGCGGYKTPDATLPGAKLGTATTNWCPKYDANTTMPERSACFSRNGNCPKGFLYLNKPTYKAWENNLPFFKGDCVSMGFYGEGSFKKDWANPLCDPWTKRDNGVSSDVLRCWRPVMHGGEQGNETSLLIFRPPTDYGGMDDGFGNIICKSGLSCHTGEQVTWGPGKGSYKAFCFDSTKPTKGVTKWFNTENGPEIHCLDWKNPRCPDKSKPCPSIAEAGGKCVLNPYTAKRVASGAETVDPDLCRVHLTKSECDKHLGTLYQGVHYTGCAWQPLKSGTPAKTPTKAPAKTPSKTPSKPPAKAPVAKPTTSPKPTPKAKDVAKSAAPAKSTVPKHVASKMAAALPSKTSTSTPASHSAPASHSTPASHSDPASHSAPVSHSKDSSSDKDTNLINKMVDFCKSMINSK